MALAFFTYDCTVMYENLFAIIALDKTVALMKIEPLDYAGLTVCHDLYTSLAFILERS
jgi:hypothetical protein